MWRHAGAAALTLLAGVARRRSRDGAAMRAGDREYLTGRSPAYPAHRPRCGATVTGAARRPSGPAAAALPRRRPVVPDAEFTSYYGRPVVKASPWEADIPAYLFLGGVAAGSSLLAAGADLTGRRRCGAPDASAASARSRLSFAALVHDLGRPARFAQHAAGGQADVADVGRHLDPHRLRAVGGFGRCGRDRVFAAAAAATPASAGDRAGSGRPAGSPRLARPGMASYTAVLLADTATPAWHEAYRELPFVFAGSAAGAAGGLALLTVPRSGESGPARRLAVLGVAVEIAADARMQDSMGLATEPLRVGAAGRLRRAGQLLTACRRGGRCAARRP